MKKVILTLIMIVLALAMAACGGTSAEPAAASAAESQNDDVAATENGDDNSTDTARSERQFGLPTEMALMLGIVKLDETDYAVGAEQASELLPLWKALRSLGESETAAQAEVDAVIAQIEDTMTPEQISAIEAMELTMQDATSIAEAMGIEMSGFGGRMGEITPEMQATMEAARESGQMPEGGPGGGMGPGGGLGPGGGQGPGGAEMDPTARETAMAERGGVRGAGFGVNTVFLDALIEFLEAKVQ